MSVAHAGPEIAFNPSPLVFNPVVVGEDRDTTLVVKNIGDTTLVVSAISLARGESSTFAFSADPFHLAPGDSVMIEMIFRFRTGGTHADALIFEINAEPSDPTLPRPVVSVSGIWQVVSEDIAGVETIWQFTTAGDTDPPVFMAGPDIVEMTGFYIGAGYCTQ